ncbi:unnamed protein product [Kluyveromyces dobzhanskii CBS 2104]|uniref:WGS project CCBQ000000000 data, contig 00047 n=1 Tax=Kluyveromyces dobzhanskii CBS 2104 TaxID=1427455 RepID=A0A0A8L0L4_9SACH|nr:unnamed protein product [Kluyveromyces dobzhanskii CBS 2104]
MVETDRASLLPPVRSSLNPELAEGLAVYVGAEVAEAELLLDSEDDRYGSTSGVEEGSREPEMSLTRLHIIIASMCLGSFLAALDNTIVSTLLSHIASEFNELSHISWIATAYLLSSATFQPLYGKVSDIFGRRPLIIISNLFFILGCLICGFSSNLWSLVAGRFIAGIGGGGVTSLGSITASDIVPLRSRALYQGIFNFFYGLGIAIGGLIGGWFSEGENGWRMAFLAQVPLCAVSLVLIVVFLKLPPGCKGLGMISNDKGGKVRIGSKLKKIDWLGSLTLVTFLFTFMLASSLGGEEIPYGSALFKLLVVGTILFGGAFLYTELYISDDPILPVRFLTNRSILGASFANWFCMMSTVTLAFYVPVYWSSVLNLKPTEMGSRIAPNFFSTAFGSIGAGYYMKRTGHYYSFLLKFTGLMVIGQLQVLLMKPDISNWRQYILLPLPQFGGAVLITVTLLAMIAAVPHEHQAATTSISYAFRSTGSTLGVSVGAALFRNKLSVSLYDSVMKFESEEYSKKYLLTIIHQASESSEYVHAKAPKFIQATLVQCYEQACKLTFTFCFIAAIFAWLSCGVIKEYKLHASMERK